MNNNNNSNNKNNSNTNMNMNMNINNNSNMNNVMGMPQNTQNKMENNQTSNKNEFTLYFNYKQKEVFLNCDPDEPFNNIISKLYKEYENFRKIRIKKIINNGKIISDLSKSCKDYKIKTESKIFLLD